MMTVGELKAALAQIPDETQISCEMNDEIIGEVIAAELTDGVLILFASENDDEEGDEGDEEDDEEDEPANPSE